MSNKEKIAAKAKAWNETNKEKIAIQKKAYYKANKERISARQRAYHKANKEKQSARASSYYEANKEAIAIKAKVYHEANKEKIRVYEKQYREDNKEKRRVYEKQYREDNKAEMASKQRAYHKANYDPKKRKAYHEANKEENNAKGRAYYAANRERVAVTGAAYYKANREKCNAASLRWRIANPEKVRKTIAKSNEKRKGYQKQWREDNKARIATASKRSYGANKEKVLARQKITHPIWAKKNKDKVCALASKRRALVVGAILPSSDMKKIEKLYTKGEDLNKKNKIQYHVDHIIPISIGGAHHQDNMRVITAKENMEKSDKYIPELGGVWADNDLAREYKKKHNIK